MEDATPTDGEEGPAILCFILMDSAQNPVISQLKSAVPAVALCLAAYDISSLYLL